MSIVVWDKWGRTPRGKLVVSVGGLRWYPYRAKRPKTIKWADLEAE